MLIAAAAALLVAAGAISLTIVEDVSKGPAFQSAADYLRNSKEAGDARQQLGVVLGFGLGVTGPITESGSGGTANISFDVHGNWRSGRVSHDPREGGLVLGGDTTALLTVDGQRYRMPCEQPPSITSCRQS